jgi:hypothetical protein
MPSSTNLVMKSCGKSFFNLGFNIDLKYSADIVGLNIAR